MITRRRLFKNFGAAVVVGAVAPSTLIEAVTTAPRTPASSAAAPVSDAVLELTYYPSYPCSIVRLLTLMFGSSG